MLPAWLQAIMVLIVCALTTGGIAYHNDVKNRESNWKQLDKEDERRFGFFMTRRQSRYGDIFLAGALGLVLGIVIVALLNEVHYFHLF